MVLSSDSVSNAVFVLQIFLETPAENLVFTLDLSFFGFLCHLMLLARISNAANLFA